MNTTEGTTMTDDEMDPYVVTYRDTAGERRHSTIWAKSSADAQERFEESDDGDGSEIINIVRDE